MANCAEGVLKYLVTQNRPYSATDIVQNMHKEFGKTAIQKALDQLVEQARIIEKAYGKQKVYCALQEDSGSRQEMAKEIEELDLQIARATDSLRSVEQQVRDSEGLLKELESTPTNEQAELELEGLRKRLEGLRSRLADLVENGVKVSPEELLDITKQHAQILKEYRKRKRICTDILDSILEGYPKSKKALLEEAGVETDEEAGVKL